jgi:hypothetical protein
VEAGFRFDPSRGVDPTDEAAVKSKYQRLKQDPERQLRAGPTELQRLRDVSRQEQERVRAPLVQLATALVGPGEGRRAGGRVTRLCGADGCRTGWVAITEDLESRALAWHVAPCLTTLAASTPPIDLIALDVPIGLPAAGPRARDVAARRLLGPGRASSVFPAPGGQCQRNERRGIILN